MAIVKIDTGPIEATAYLSRVPKDKWRLLIGTRKRFLVTRLPSDCRELLRFYEEAEEMWSALGYSSRDDLITKGLGLDLQDVTWALDGLKRWKPNEAMPFEKAIALGKNGGDRKSNKFQRSERTLKRGETAEYLTARIARDAQDAEAKNHEKAKIAFSKFQQGEYKSVRAAAINAGIVIPDTPLILLQRAWKRASQNEQKEFIKWTKEEM